MRSTWAEVGCPSVASGPIVSSSGGNTLMMHLPSAVTISTAPACTSPHVNSSQVRTCKWHHAAATPEWSHSLLPTQLVEHRSGHRGLQMQAIASQASLRVIN